MKVASLFVLMVIFGITSGLRCYNCQSEGCGRFLGIPPLFPHLESCGTRNDTVKMFCIKITSGDTVQGRGCANTEPYPLYDFPNATLGCHHHDQYTPPGLRCFCDTDGCNRSEGLTGSLSMSLGLTVILLWKTGKL